MDRDGLESGPHAAPQRSAAAPQQSPSSRRRPGGASGAHLPFTKAVPTLPDWLGQTRSSFMEDIPYTTSTEKITTVFQCIDMCGTHTHTGRKESTCCSSGMGQKQRNNFLMWD